MTLSGASLLFNKAKEVHEQLEYVCSQHKSRTKNFMNPNPEENLYFDLLTSMEELCNFGNTRDNRIKLQSFLLRYTTKIKIEFNNCNIDQTKIKKQQDDVYSLK